MIKISAKSIPFNWNIKRIEDITSIKTGGTPSTKIKEYWENGNIPWMVSGDIHKGVVKNISKKITKLGLKNSPAKILPIGSVMIALNGQGVTKGMVAYLEIQTTCNQSLVAIIPNEIFFNSKYLYFNLQSRYKEIRGLADLNARTGLNLNLLKRIEVLFPPINEQTEISSILSTVDDLIENTTNLINSYTLLKKGLMQTLLTKGIGYTKFKKTEIGEIPEEWEIKKLGDIASFAQGVQVDLNLQSKELKENYEKFLRIENYTQNSKDFRYIPKDLGRNKFINKDDIVMVRYGACGYIGRGFEGILANNLFKINPTTQKLDKSFLYYFLNSNIAQAFLSKLMYGNALQAISFSIVKELIIILPAIKEQKKIVSIFSIMDWLIDLNTEKKEKLETLKKGLMQQLLTGKIRVKV
jgi:type I restriction enzyme, S subunit